MKRQSNGGKVGQSEKTGGAASDRGQWASSIGFLLAAMGSAVGLGNIVKFPYLAGKYGGGTFLVVYLILLVLVAFPAMLAEFVVGRKANKNAVSAFRELNRKFVWVGALGLIVGFVILCYYAVIGGWTLRYCQYFLMGGNFKDGSETVFNNFVRSGLEPIVWLFVFILLTTFIVFRGVSGGIERANKILMPALIVLLLIVIGRSATLPGAVEGILYYLLPDISRVSGETFTAALAQIFFSCSVGMGIMVTYASYLPKSNNLSKSALIVPLLDTLVAFLSGFAVIPAMFSMGAEPTESTIGSMFVVMPGVFASMPFANIFGAIFFLLVFFAALTSSISLLEGSLSWVTERFKWTRGKACVILAPVVFVVGCFASLSFGGNLSINFIQLTRNGFGVAGLFDFLSETPDILLMPICAMAFCLFVGWIMGVKAAKREIELCGNKFHLERYWNIGVRFIAPLGIFIILLGNFGIFGGA